MENDRATSKSEAPSKKAPRWLYVINNEERLRILVLRGKSNKGESTITPGPRIDLAPGANIVDSALWERWKRENVDQDDDGVPTEGSASQLLATEIQQDTHPHRRREAAGKAFLVEGPAIVDRIVPLAGLEEPVAKKLVPEIRSELELRRLLKQEQRQTIAAALAQHLDALVKAANVPVG